MLPQETLLRRLVNETGKLSEEEIDNIIEEMAKPIFFDTPLMDGQRLVIGLERNS